MQKQYLIKFRFFPNLLNFLETLRIYGNIIVLTEILTANIIDIKTLISVGGKECILLTFFFFSIFLEFLSSIVME